MNIMNIEHISKIFGEKTIFDDASIGIQEGDKIGIVGINGTGKSTLLRMIAGDEVPDSGNIIRQNQLKLAWLPQEPKFPENATILSYAGDDETGWKVQSNLSQLGIMDYSMPIDQLSGGQKRKVALAKVLAQDFDVLLLDEPTNDLDIESIEMLEATLAEYPGTVLLVTHDRSFMDNVATLTIAPDKDGVWTSYVGGYEEWLKWRDKREKEEQKAAEAAAQADKSQKTRRRNAKPGLSYKENKLLQELPGQIEALENRQNELVELMQQPSYGSKAPEQIRADGDEMQKIAKELEEKYALWEELEEKQSLAN